MSLRCLSKSTLVTIVLVGVSLVGLAIPRKGKTESKSLSLRPEDGTLFMRRWLQADDRLWMLTPGRSPLHPLEEGIAGEPARSLHGGYCWFVTVREIDGQCYPNGDRRKEVFAIRQDGHTVQLTDQPELEPALCDPCWPVHGQDRLISWIARRWGSDGQVETGGIYTATLLFDSRDNITGLAEQPHKPLLDLVLVSTYVGSDLFVHDPIPDILSHDWSPDGEAIVYDTLDEHILVRSLQRAAAVRLIASSACGPSWSPRGDRIAFKFAEPLGSMATIRPDGSDVQIVTACGFDKKEVFVVAPPLWSPDGRYLGYQRVDGSGSPHEPVNVDVWVSAADGQAHLCLTDRTKDFFLLTAWRRSSR